MRTDSPFVIESFNQSAVQTFTMPGTVETLQVATLDPVMLTMLGFDAISNVTSHILQVD